LTRSAPRAVSADDLVVLNREIAAIVRAGVPLEVGLGGLSAGLPRSLGNLTDRLATRLRQGESLPAALDAEGSALPPVYRAVVRAGLESGRLPAALESLSAHARSIVDLRRRIIVALIYPAIVFAIAYLLFVLVAQHVVLGLATMYDMPQPAWLPALVAISRFLGTWGWVLPAVVAACVVWSIISSGLAGGRASIGGPLMAALPGIGALNRNFRTATFTELLAMLLEHDVPLDESLRIAADASGDRRLIDEMKSLATRVRGGETLAAATHRAAALPPLARWMIAAGERQGGLPATLRQVAEFHRRRAQRQAERMKVLWPLAIVVVLGGGAVLLYALFLFVPLTGLFRDLGT
jgi:general secretion pathway protein F